MADYERFVHDGYISFGFSDASLIHLALNEKYIQSCQFADENGIDPRSVPLLIHMKDILVSLSLFLSCH